MNEKQDRQGVRTVAALEQKYRIGKNLDEAKRESAQAKQAVAGAAAGLAEQLEQQFNQYAAGINASVNALGNRVTHVEQELEDLPSGGGGAYSPGDSIPYLSAMTFGLLYGEDGNVRFPLPLAKPVKAGTTVTVETVESLRVFCTDGSVYSQSLARYTATLTAAGVAEVVVPITPAQTGIKICGVIISVGIVFS